MPFEHEESSDPFAQQSAGEASPLGSRPAVGARHANPAEALGSDSAPVGPGGGDFLGLNQEVRPGARGQAQYALQQESAESAPESESELELELEAPLAIDSGESEESAQPAVEAELQPAPALPKAAPAPVAAATAPARRSPVLMLCLIGFSVGILGAVALPFLDSKPESKTEVAAVPASGAPQSNSSARPKAQPESQKPASATRSAELVAAQPNASTSSEVARSSEPNVAAPIASAQPHVDARNAQASAKHAPLVASALPELPGAFAKEVLVLSEVGEADLRATDAAPAFDLTEDDELDEAVASALEPLPPVVELESEFDEDSEEFDELEAVEDVQLVQGGPAVPPAASASSAASTPNAAAAASEAAASTTPSAPVAPSPVAVEPAAAPAPALNAPIVAAPAQPAQAPATAGQSAPAQTTPAQPAPSTDLAMIWQADTVPLDKIAHGARVLTPSVGNVRVAMASGDHFEGKLYAVGQSKVVLDTSTGRIELKGSEVKSIERILSTPAELGEGDSPLPGTWVRYKTRGGTIYGKLISMDGNRVTIETPERARITLQDGEIEPAKPPKDGEAKSGGSSDKPKKLNRPKPKKK